MEGVRTVVEVIVAAARVDTVAVGRLWRGCLNLVVTEDGQGEQRHCNAGSEKQRHVCEHVPTAPPGAASRGHGRILADLERLSIVENTDSSNRFSTAGPGETGRIRTAGTPQSVPPYSGSV
jgi:hypothetical protein